MQNENIDTSQPLGAFLGATIKQLRSHHGLTIADVSERAGISRGMLSKIENAPAAASLETLALLDPKLKKLDSISEKTSLKDQVELFVDVVYELIKEDNDIKKEDLKKFLTMEACTDIVQKAMGSLR